MKLVQIMVHFEYTEDIEEILDQHGKLHFVRYPMMESRDIEGKHFGSQIFPGNVTVYQAQVEDENLDGLLYELRAFREQKTAYQHLQALVLPIERAL
ncbi:PG0541 family transporter-associated protein [Desulfurispira natronophila]|uniref:DUF4286 family protein n=1 Tax=Desulfurispira natronophila TaxID=682562 RepID=A0A7W7Y3U8_9BACT|nr:PG0541 family transporter-associated protein [Desulfurispira natronophila]MBB5021562.1 hypothetical protein [Desulfurispira natronophila]